MSDALAREREGIVCFRPAAGARGGFCVDLAGTRGKLGAFMNFRPKMIFGDAPNAYFSEIEKTFRGGGEIFLGDPRWSAEQRGAAETLVAARAERTTRERGNAAASAGKIFVASGGSGGKIRFVAHTERTLEASAKALVRALGLAAGTPLNAFACLPPWHVSGLMPFVRARVSGGRTFVAENGSFRDAGALVPFRKSADEFWMNSLVPTQLKRVLRLDGGAEWLRSFDFILLGGAAVPADLIEEAMREKLPVGIGYGMTETASLVALWRAEEGFPVAGTPLPHARFVVSERDSRIGIFAESLGETLAEDGSLAPNTDGFFLTNDEGRFDERGRLIVLGRADRYIVSGGEKIDPALVEAALLRAGAESALVTGEPDEIWGERVVALVAGTPDPEILPRTKKALPPWMAPKRIVFVPALPIDGKGKVDRAALRAALAAGGNA